jgi:hypothetical protein
MIAPQNRVGQTFGRPVIARRGIVDTRKFSLWRGRDGKERAGMRELWTCQLFHVTHTKDGPTLAFCGAHGRQTIRRHDMGQMSVPK